MEEHFTLQLWLELNTLHDDQYAFLRSSQPNLLNTYQNEKRF